MTDDDPLVHFHTRLPKSIKQDYEDAAKANGVSTGVVSRWVHERLAVRDFLRSLTAPMNAARNDGDHPGG